MATKGSDPIKNFLAGGTAGICEAVVCCPMDVIKTRMQLQPDVYRGILQSARHIASTESPQSLWKGLPAMASGVFPKAAVRFASVGFFKAKLADDAGKVSAARTFAAGVGAGIIESIVVVTPVEVVKIRLQADTGLGAKKRYSGAMHGAKTIMKEEGVLALYKGLMPTMLRQSSNQGVRFLIHGEVMSALQEKHGEKLWWHGLAGGGAAGVLGCYANNPLDVVKTRMQRQEGSIAKGTAQYKGDLDCARQILKAEGPQGFWRGALARAARVGPGQAILFTMYPIFYGLLDAAWMREAVIVARQPERGAERRQRPGRERRGRA